MPHPKKIDSYSFGRMTIAEREFSSDLLLFPDGRIQDHWWRSEGHHLVPEDIMELIDLIPTKIIIGTGSAGMMQVSERVFSEARARGTMVEACPTAEAVRYYNDFLASGNSLAACFHLTC